ncbi:MAG: FAD binding domain-containing protein [Candidatus Bruticola sp.]
MFSEFHKPSSLQEAAALRSRLSSSAYLGGGTILNTITYAKEVPEEEQATTLISLAGLNLKQVELNHGELIIGSGLTHQELLENEIIFPSLKEAASYLVNRNIRNMATVGGNIALRGTACNLYSMLLALGARLELMKADGNTYIVSIDDYNEHGAPADLILNVRISEEMGRRRFASRRYVRTQNDISIVSAYAIADGDAEHVKDLRLVMGGFAAHPVRLTEIESLVKGAALPDRDYLAAQIRPLLNPIADIRGGVAFKREVGAQIAAWSIYKAFGQL